MTFDLRALTQDDRAQLPQLMADAFGRGALRTPPTLEDLQKPTSLCWGIFDGSRLVASAAIHDLTMQWGQVAYRMGGVAGVACVTDQRGRGHVARLLKHSLVQMKEAGQSVSGLYPFSFAFYRRHGWDWVGEKRRYTLTLAEIPSYPEGAHTSMVDVEAVLPELKDCYARYASRYPGMLDRVAPIPNYWQGLQDRDNKRTYVFAYRHPLTGVVDGYLSFRFPDDGDVGQVGDFFANSPEAYRGLLSILHYYGTQIRKATWTAPVDDRLPLYVMSNDLEMASRPLFMGRIVDIAGAFEKVTFPMSVGGKVIVKVDDPNCEWNSGCWSIETMVAGVTVERTTEEPGVSMDIQALSQAFWGQPSLAMLRNAGRIEVVDERQYELLSLGLPPRVCYLQDFF